MKPLNVVGAAALAALMLLAIVALCALQVGCAKSPMAPASLECQHCADDCAGCRAAIMDWSEKN